MHPNEDVVRKAYEAFAGRDMAALFELLSDEITFVIPGKSIQAGTFAGKDAVRGYFSIAGAHTGGTHRVELLDLLANDIRAVALVRALGQRGDQLFDMTVIHIWQLLDGKLAKVSVIPTDQYAFDAFWS